jgi:hypothetical protein
MFLSLALATFAPTFVQLPSAPSSSMRSTEALPMPNEGITLRFRQDGGAATAPTLYEVLLEFERVTGQHAIVSTEIATTLRKSYAHLTHELAAKHEDVYFVVETLFASSGFALAYLSTTAPRLFTLQSVHSGDASSLRSAARYVPSHELGAWSRHPAVLVTTALELDATDVRTLSNSLRSMFTDANTQQIVPIGNSDTILLTGFAPNVLATKTMLEAANEVARRTNEARAKADADARARAEKPKEKEGAPK